MMDKAGHVPAVTTVTVTNPLLQGLLDAFKNGYVRPQVPALDKYWANYCGSDQIFEKGVSPAAWVKNATDAAKK
jgi:maltose-binding protein MalE